MDDAIGAFWVKGQHMSTPYKQDSGIGRQALAPFDHNILTHGQRLLSSKKKNMEASMRVPYRETISHERKSLCGRESLVETEEPAFVQIKMGQSEMNHMIDDEEYMERAVKDSQTLIMETKRQDITLSYNVGLEYRTHTNSIF
jgi:hypothetical protein